MKNKLKWLIPSREFRLFCLPLGVMLLWEHSTDKIWPEWGWFIFSYVFAVFLCASFGYYLKKWYISRDSLEQEELRIKEAKTVVWQDLGDQFRNALGDAFDSDNTQIDAVTAELVAIVKREL